ncbi:MAG: AraC family ligand binding domain-containing protein, partial [Chitinophaga rupis]
MLDYYKYLPLSAEDESWGLSVVNTGSTHILPGTAYPGGEHPAHHYFSWEKGRVLQEHQVIYITRGAGSFESDSGGRKKINAGTIILLFPGERHRYRPDKKTGWDEYWVGFRGPITQRLFDRKLFFKPDNPVINIGFKEELLSLFQGVIDQTQKEKAGYQPLIAGIVMHILGLVYTHSRQDAFEGQDIDHIV